MKTLEILFVSVLAVFAFGCSVVTLLEPLPEQGFSKEDLKALSGTWMGDKICLNVGCSDDGKAYLGVLKWKDNDFVVQKYRLYFTKIGENSYVSLNDDKKGKYFFAEFGLDDKQMLVWVPDSRRIDALIQAKILHGSVKKDHSAMSIELSDSAADFVKVLSKEKNLFNYRKPILILKKIE